MGAVSFRNLNFAKGLIFTPTGGNFHKIFYYLDSTLFHSASWRSRNKNTITNNIVTLSLSKGLFFINIVPNYCER